MAGGATLTAGKIPVHLQEKAPASAFGGKNGQDTQASERLLNVVGLFGVCGSSTWREGVMKTLEAAGVGYFNPQVKEWTSECAVIEAKNLASDKVVLFVISGDTTAYGSLAETGFAVVNAILNGQKVGFVVETHVEPELDEKANSKTDTNRARKLVRAHLKELGETHPELREQVFVAENLGQLVDWAVTQMKA